MNLYLYNFKNQIIEKFYITNHKEYESFRASHIQQIILHLMNEEFNVGQYKENGLIIDHFPLHNFPWTINIIKFWIDDRKKFFKNTFQRNTKIHTLRPLNMICNYYGARVH